MRDRRDSRERREWQNPQASLAFPASHALLAPTLLLASAWHPSCSFQKQQGTTKEDGIMSRVHWWLVGAIALGIAVLVYLVFFCPEECH